MRDRSWRRHVEEKKVILRLSRITYYSRFSFPDANNNYRKFIDIKDYIGLAEAFQFKNYTTTSFDSKYKSKYSPNKGKRYYRDGVECREKQKILFLKILREYGIK